MDSGIYRIVNRTNRKCYVGSTIDFQVRWRAHVADLNGQKHHSPSLQRAWNKYGAKNFDFQIIELVANHNFLIAFEQSYMDYYKPEYNICKVAGSCLGRKFSEETKQKMRNSHLGKHHTQAHKDNISASITGEKNGFYGKTHSEETRAKIKEARALQVISEETKAKISEKTSGKNNPFYGRKHTLETKEKMRERKRQRALLASK